MVKQQRKTNIIVLGLIGGLVVFFMLSQSINKEGGTKEGFLALNTDKSVYSLNEKVEFDIISLDKDGNTLCHSNLELVIDPPSGKRITLSTAGGKILGSATCSEDNTVTYASDYRAGFTPEKEGQYKVVLKNLDTRKEIESSIKVEDQPRVSLSRSGATRINPFKSDRYPMVFTLKSLDDFNGQLVEQLPESFVIIWQGEGKVASGKITWDLEMKAGETKEIIYEFNAPQGKSSVYSLGKAFLMEGDTKIYEENHTWQIVTGNDESIEL